MNSKAKKFTKMLKENKLNFFTDEEIEDEFNTVLYRSTMEIEGQRLPVVVVIDDSIYVVCRILVVGKSVTQGNRAAICVALNKLNASYKTFKYYVTEAGEVVLDACLPSTVEKFEPDMIRALIDLAVKNLEENYRPLMKIIWGTQDGKHKESAE